MARARARPCGARLPPCPHRLRPGNKQSAQNYRGRSRAYRVSSRAFSSFLYSAHHWRNGFSPGFLLRIPRAREMAAAVIGFSKIPSGVDSTTAFVPFSISNSLRIRRGITTWPFVVKDTVSARSVALIRIYATKYTEVSQRIVCRNSDLLTHLILVDRQIRLVAHARAGSRGVVADPGGFHSLSHFEALQLVMKESKGAKPDSSGYFKNLDLLG